MFQQAQPQQAEPIRLGSFHQSAHAHHPYSHHHHHHHHHHRHHNQNINVNSNTHRSNNNTSSNQTFAPQLSQVQQQQQSHQQQQRQQQNHLPNYHHLANLQLSPDVLHRLAQAAAVAIAPLAPPPAASQTQQTQQAAPAVPLAPLNTNLNNNISTNQHTMTSNNHSVTNIVPPLSLNNAHCNNLISATPTQPIINNAPTITNANQNSTSDSTSTASITNAPQLNQSQQPPTTAPGLPLFLIQHFQAVAALLASNYANQISPALFNDLLLEYHQQGGDHRQQLSAATNNFTNNTSNNINNNNVNNSNNSSNNNTTPAHLQPQTQSNPIQPQQTQNQQPQVNPRPQQVTAPQPTQVTTAPAPPTTQQRLPLPLPLSIPPPQPQPSSQPQPTQQQAPQQQQQPQQAPTSRPSQLPLPFPYLTQIDNTMFLTHVINQMYNFGSLLHGNIRPDPHLNHHNAHFHHMHNSQHHHQQPPPHIPAGQNTDDPMVTLSDSKPRGLTRAEIESLTSYTQLNEKDPRTCVICLSKFELKSKIRPLSCQHAYHAKCVDKWLKANRTCPICRRDALKGYSAKIKKLN